MFVEMVVTVLFATTVFLRRQHLDASYPGALVQPLQSLGALKKLSFQESG